MLISYNWLKDFVKNLPKPEKLAELLTMHFAEVEDVKKIKGDFVFNIDIRPNRAAEGFAHLSIAREAAAIADLKIQIPETKTRSWAAPKTADLVRVEVKDRRACPRYSAKAIIDVKVGPSPSRIQERLKACGLRPVNNIVDVTNYVMLETGQPLHAFDLEKLAGNKILVRFARKNESIVTLDGGRIELDPSVLVIADAVKPVAVAGIKGGKAPEIDKKTKKIIIESANFNPHVVRKGSKKTGLKTDASIRFEHGLNPSLTEFALNRAAYLVQKTAKGKITKDMADAAGPMTAPARVKLDLSYLNGLLGMNVSKAKAVKILKALNFKIIKQAQKFLLVEAPSFRLDIALPEDIIEEVGRIIGYQEIPAVFPAVSLAPAARNDELFWEDIIKNILKEAGFTESYNYSFIGDREAKIFKYKNTELIELRNPLSVDQKYLRPSIIPVLLANAKKNVNNFSSIKIFELGKIFEKALASKDKKQLTGLVTGEDFYQLKGAVDLLLEKLGISSAWYDEYQPTPEESKMGIWHPKKCAEIKTDEGEIGFLGEISPKILGQAELPGKVVVFDINFDKLVKMVSAEHEYRPISKFPAVIRDLAVLVPRKTKVEEVLNKINSAGGELIRDIDLFDIYEGGELPDGKKNLAFHIVYQSEVKTLRSGEVDAIQQKIIKSLEKDPRWEFRK